MDNATTLGTWGGTRGGAEAAVSVSENPGKSGKTRENAGPLRQDSLLHDVREGVEHSLPDVRFQRRVKVGNDLEGIRDGERG